VRLTCSPSRELARHSDIRLTLARYSHVGMHDLTAAVQSLPSVLPLGTATNQAQRLAATGTDGEESLRPACAKLAPPADIDRDLVMSIEETGGKKGDAMASDAPERNPLQRMAVATDCGGLITIDTEGGTERTGFSDNLPVANSQL
jgi:hypothetical protein